MPQRYDFGSPGAAAFNAIEQFLLQRALKERDDAEFAFKQRQAKEAADRAAQQLMLQAETQNLQRQQEARIAEAQRQAQTDLEQEREFRRATTIANAATPGDPVDEITAEVLKRQGYGSQIQRGQPAQGAYLGDDESGVPQYDVVPGILQLRGGSQYLNARAQAEERAAQAAAARTDAAERARLDREARIQMAEIAAAASRDRPGNVSDYEAHLRRWAKARGTTIENLTDDQELQARRSFFDASRERSFFDELGGEGGGGTGGRAPMVVVPSPSAAPAAPAGGSSSVLESLRSSMRPTRTGRTAELTGPAGQAFGGDQSNVHDDELHQELAGLRNDVRRATGQRPIKADQHPPKEGEIRIINGQRARWDGFGWLAVP